MYNVVKIGSQDVPMLSMASIDIYYQHIFHEDPIKLQASKDMNEGEMLGLMQKMGFVMAMFAKTRDRKEMLKLNEDSYIEWLEHFDRAEYIDALPDISSTYAGQNITHSTEKKSKDQ